MVIDNTNLLNLCRDCGATGFIPVLSYTYNAGTAIVIVTDGSTLPAGDALAIIKVKVHDFFGKEVRDKITALAGNTGNIDVSSLDRSKPLCITASIHTDGHIAADGIATDIGAAGTIGFFDVQKNA